MLKNFQLHFTPRAFRAESDAWRAVIHLNLVRSVNFIIDLLSQSAGANLAHSNSTTYRPHGDGPLYSQGGDASPTATTFGSPYQHHRTSQKPPPSNEIRRFKLALSPLRQVEVILAKQLSVHERDIMDPSGARLAARPSEVTVRGGRGWTSLLRRKPLEGVLNQHQQDHVEALENARQILDACRADIVALWTSESVQAGLKEEGIVLKEQSGLCVSVIVFPNSS